MAAVIAEVIPQPLNPVATYLSLIHILYTTVIDDMDYAVKPMNCPGGMLVYKMEPRSYKELPLRLGELGLVHRHEKSGQLHGLMRVRCLSLIHILFV